MWALSWLRSVDDLGIGVLREGLRMECDPSPFRGCERAVRVQGVGAFYVRWGRGNYWLARPGAVRVVDRRSVISVSFWRGESKLNR